MRLETTEDDKARLLETMKRYNEACNFVAKRAYSLKLANKYKLHKEVYVYLVKIDYMRLKENIENMQF